MTVILSIETALKLRCNLITPTLNPWRALNGHENVVWQAGGPAGGSTESVIGVFNHDID